MLLLLAPLAFAQDDDPWLTRQGVTGYSWGTTDIPVDGVPRPKDLVLPDSGWIGANPQDRPEDLELKAVPGERRFVRYAHGVLVDAWVVSDHPLDPAYVVGSERPEWTGTVLGPADGGFLAYGVAKSWTIGDRTVLYWRDRSGKREILASRAVPTGAYGVGRPKPLAAPGDTRAKATIKGDLRKAARASAGTLASCFDTSPKPVTADITLGFDGAGQADRIRVVADQPAFELEECVAASLMDVHGPARGEGSLTLMRFR
jgi:hypothetical protein